MRIIPPGSGQIAASATYSVISLVLSVLLIRSGLGGLVVVLPIAALGLVMIGRWFGRRVLIRESRVADLDEELKKLLKGN